MLASMAGMITNEERRLRLAERHHHGRTATGPEAAVRSVAALHSTDPTTPYLSGWARVPGFAIDDLGDALYRTRSLIRMHTIRRTLFVLDRSDAVLFEAGATRDIARKEWARLYKALAAVMPEQAIEPHLERVADEILAALKGRELSTKELSAAVPDLGRKFEMGSGKWITEVPLGTRLPYILAMEGRLIRAEPLGTWRSSQYRWALAEDWLGGAPEQVTEEEGAIGVLRRYLETHGPATITDIRWWTGWTVARTKSALAKLETEEVELEGDAVGLVLAGDPGAGGGGDGAVAFLPSLDSSTMGWKERDWYLGPHGSEVFDSIGNAGPTVWADGRIVGGWSQRPDGTVVYELLDDLSPRIGSRVEEEATSLGEWLGERVVMPRFPSPLGKRLAAWSP